MHIRRTVGVWLLVLTALGGPHLAVGADVAVPAPEPEPAVPRLDVPFVPQSGALCGGAALAMVFRYWGGASVLAEDFAALVDGAREGIPTGVLTEAARSRGWYAFALQLSPAAAREHLARGRPLIVLIRNRGGSFHYVVLLGWIRDEVICHDPQAGPFRTRTAVDFEAAWAGSGNWALLVLPGATTPAPLPADSTRVSPRLESASERFRAGDWLAAAQLAEQALAADPNEANPDNADVWRLLGGSRFLAGQVERALRAWNHLDEPRVDLLRIDGLRRIRYADLAEQIGLPAGRLLTPGVFRQARRRLAEAPTVQAYRMELKPRAGGVAQVDVALLERPLIDAGVRGAVVAAARAAVHREVVVEVAGLAGSGELLTATWRWWAPRRCYALAAAVAAPDGRPGLWRVAGVREEQTYTAATPGVTAPGDDAVLVKEVRRRLSLSRADWVTADLRLELGAALDSWADRGSHLALSGGIVSRGADDRLTLGAKISVWRSLHREDPFAAADLHAAWGPAVPATEAAWLFELGLSGATHAAPLALWSGAGTGEGREPLLRAHPLLAAGVIDSRVFGRRLVHLTIERQTWPWKVGPLPCGWALFIDTVGVGRTGQIGSTPWQMDGGVGLRLRMPGLRGGWRLDVAQGFTDGNRAVSVAWQGP